MTSVSPCSSPSRSRCCSRSTRSPACAGVHDHVVAGELDVEGLRVVGPRIERAAGHEVEAGVVPVTGQEAGLDRALMQRETEMRAPVLDREGASLVPNDDDGKRADLAQQPSFLLEFGERPEAGRRGERVGHGSTFRPA